MTVSAIRRIAGSFAATALALSAPARAEVPASPCWDPASMSAARISELNTMLMVSSLRCRRVGIDLQPAYERVSALYSQAFKAAEARIKAHFGGVDHSDSRDDYDSYVVGVANFYGSGRSDPATCQAFGALEKTLAEASANLDLLATLAIRMVRDPHVGGTGRCAATTHVASKR